MEEPMGNPKNNPKLPTSSGETAGPTVIQRWSAARKREVVLRLLRGESLDAVSREIGVEVYRLERWRDRALAALDAGLTERSDDDPLQAGLDAGACRTLPEASGVASRADGGFAGDGAGRAGGGGSSRAENPPFPARNPVILSFETRFSAAKSGDPGRKTG
jgi:transposase-like protein